MSNELLQQALDALERILTTETFRKDPRGDTAGPAIDAIREYLAQPQAEPMADLYQHCETGRTRVVMRGDIADANAAWDLIGPLYLHSPYTHPAAPAPVPLTPDCWNCVDMQKRGGMVWCARTGVYDDCVAGSKHRARIPIKLWPMAAHGITQKGTP